MMFHTIPTPSGVSWLALLADHLYVPDQRRHICVRQSTIILVKGARSSVELVFADGNRRIVSTHLSQFQTYLNDTLFVQVSRSHIVNLLFLETLHAGSVEVGGYTIPLSGTYRTSLLDRLKLVRLRPEAETATLPY